MNRGKAINIALVVMILALASSYLYLQGIKNAPPEEIAGIDSDNNGVRDDVDEYVNAKYAYDNNLRLALLEYARHLQLALVNADNEALSITESHRYGPIADCIYRGIVQNLEEARKVREDVGSMVVNTASRKAAYRKYNSQLGGQGYSLGGVEGCEQIPGLDLSKIKNYTPKQDANQPGHLTYKNEEYGYSFTYPESWIISNCVGSTVSSGQTFINRSCSSDTDIFYKNDELNGSFFASPSFGQKKPITCSQGTTSQVTISGTQATVCSRSLGDARTSSDLYFTANGYDFSVGLIENTSSNRTEDLISSLKIIQPTRNVIYNFIGKLSQDSNGQLLTDGSIESIDQNGQKSVLIDSTNKYVDGRIGKFVFPPSGDKLFFVGGRIYAYSIANKTFTKLNSSSLGTTYSPDGFKVLWNGSDSTISITDLDKDQTWQLLSLSEGETLNGVSCDPESSPTSYRIGWGDNETIRYAVYDDSQCVPDPEGRMIHPFKEIRTMKVARP
jgi:hypothetical protein